MDSSALSLITSLKCERGADSCLATEDKVMSNQSIDDVREAMRLALKSLPEEELKKPSSAWHGLTLEQCLSENPLVSLFGCIGNFAASLPENEEVFKMNEKYKPVSNKEAFEFLHSLSSGDKEANS